MYRVDQVLVPVDFSSFSRCALNFAAMLGDPTEQSPGARLQLAHAVESLPRYVRSVLFPYAPLGEDDRQFEAEIAAAVRHRIREYFQLDEALEQRCVDPPLVEFGSSKQWVTRWEGKLDVDMVAVGAFGIHGVFAAGPGATARRLVGASAVPVALIRDYEPRPRVQRIVAAVDLGRTSETVVDVAMGLAVMFQAQLELVHVIPSPFAHDTDWQVERHAEFGIEELKRVLVPQAEAKMEALVEGMELPFSATEQKGRLEEMTVAVGDPAVEIGRRVTENNGDLVVIGAGRRSRAGKTGPGRVAAAVMAEVPVHQVVVPARYETTPLSRRE